MFKIDRITQHLLFFLAIIAINDLIAGNSKAYINGSIHTFDRNLTIVDSLLVRDVIIQQIDTQAEVIKSIEMTLIPN